MTIEEDLLKQFEANNALTQEALDLQKAQIAELQQTQVQDRHREIEGQRNRLQDTLSSAKGSLTQQSDQAFARGVETMVKTAQFSTVGALEVVGAMSNNQKMSREMQKVTKLLNVAVQGINMFLKSGLEMERGFNKTSGYKDLYKSTEDNMKGLPPPRDFSDTMGGGGPT